MALLAREQDFGWFSGPWALHYVGVASLVRTTARQFDELPTEAKVDYVSQLWDRVFKHEDPESPDWHRDLVRAELEEQQTAPSASEEWATARSELLERVRQIRQ